MFYYFCYFNYFKKKVLFKFFQLKFKTKKILILIENVKLKTRCSKKKSPRLMCI